MLRLWWSKLLYAAAAAYVHWSHVNVIRVNVISMQGLYRKEYDGVFFTNIFNSDQIHLYAGIWK